MDTVEAHGSSATAQRARFAATEGGERPPGRPPVRDVWDVVVVPSRQGLEAMDILRQHTRVGPVLHDRSSDTLGFLVPAGTSAGWDLPGSACSGAVGPAARKLAAMPPDAGSGWLLPPEHAAPATDPALLRIALDEAARTIEAAGGHRRR